jgi:hypothetical protein
MIVLLGARPASSPGSAPNATDHAAGAPDRRRGLAGLVTISGIVGLVDAVTTIV